MQGSLEAMQLALRVLRFVNFHLPLDPQDVAELRGLAPGGENLRVDELACAVIQEALERNPRVRAQSKGQTS